MGLTLTAANHVVHLSRWWNPAVEDQATDRAYRIGQTRDVTVYLPQSIHPDPTIASTSFDLKLHALMERKRTLSRGLFAPGEEEGDADALFDSVVTGADVGAGAVEMTALEADRSSGASEEPAIPERFPIAAEAPISRAFRKKLSALPGFTPRPRPDETPLAASASIPQSPERQELQPARVVYQPERPRDLTIFLMPLAEDPPREIRISDPYAAAGPRARAALIDFVAMLMQGPRAPERTILITYDGESIERPPESSVEQYDQMQARWKNRFGPTAILSHQQRSKRQSADFHDRDVQVMTRSGRRYLWDLGRGVDGVMGTRFGCVINFHEI